MKKAFIIFFFVLAFLIDVPTSLAGSHKFIDRSGNLSQTSIWQYTITFAARDYWPGHAFVVWTKYKKLRQSSNLPIIESVGYGLYPNNAKKAILGTIPGGIKQEKFAKMADASRTITVAVTRQIYDYSLTNTKAMRTGTVAYNLFKSSCVDFVHLVASSIGLSTPSTRGYKNHPQGFIYRLIKMNN